MPGLILSLDPSSTATGYAVMADADTIIECGVLKPAKDSDPANTRIEAMAADVVDLIAEHRPVLILIEDTSGKVGKRHKGHGAGLAVYGKAVGYLLATAKAAGGREVVAVLENVWTGSVAKHHRQLTLKGLKGYDAAQDPGGDAADAIGLVRWWLKQRTRQAS